MATTFDQVLEAALTKKDFATIRKVLRGIGYAVAKDESEPNLFKALQTNRYTDLDQAAHLLMLEKSIRTQSVESLRLTLSMSGHDVSMPDFNKLAAERRRNEEPGSPSYFLNRTLDL